MRDQVSELDPSLFNIDPPVVLIIVIVECCFPILWITILLKLPHIWCDSVVKFTNIAI
jgi:hypothetical protein